MTAHRHLLVLLYLLFSVLQAAEVQGQSPKLSVLDPRILHHQQQKQAALALNPRDRQRFLSQHGLKTDPDRERIALYVRTRLHPEAMRALHAYGVEVDADGWIPPMPGGVRNERVSPLSGQGNAAPLQPAGRHPWGFHTATVPYAALPRLLQEPNVVRVTSLERVSHPRCDLARQVLHVEELQNAPEPFTGKSQKLSGSGVKFCLADSSLDTDHLDIPKPVEAYDVTTGSNFKAWKTNVIGAITEHGTHTTGIAVGNGHWSGGQYRGMALGASLYFYKIGDNVSGDSTNDDEIKAIVRGTEVGCRIFSLSFGSLGEELDGADPVEQAIDTATSQGVTFFVSAGNEADAGVHARVELAAGASAQVEILLDNVDGTGGVTDAISVTAAWRDGQPDDANISLALKKVGQGENFAEIDSWTSIRHTEYHLYELTPQVDAGAKHSYSLTVKNTAKGSPATVHLYLEDPNVLAVFATPDPALTVNSPAVADLALAVGAQVHRSLYTDYQGHSQSTGEMVGEIAPFSSQGPRIDGTQKPELLAPGSMMIATMDSHVEQDPTTIVDDDGQNLDGKGPAHYLAEEGTSMATPAAAGAAALLLEAAPDLNPEALRQFLTATASAAKAPDNLGGYGLINAAAAVCAATGTCGADAASAAETQADAGAGPDAPPDVLAVTADVAAANPDVSAQTSARSTGCAASPGGDSSALAACLAVLALAWSRRYA